MLIYDPIRDILGNNFKGIEPGEIMNTLATNNFDLTIGNDVLDILVGKRLSVGYILLYKTTFENQYTGFVPLYLSWTNAETALKKEAAAGGDKFSSSDKAVTLKKMLSMTENVNKLVKEWDASIKEKC